MNKRSNSVIKTVPAATALHSVPMFDPLKLLRMTTSAKTGEKVLRLDLSYKKMWFLLVHPRGRMLTNILRVTDQMAIFEAQLYADRGDNTVLAQFTSCHTRKESGPQYIRNAQDEALNEALDNAGFGIQLSDLVEHDDNGYGSEVLLSQVEALLREPEQVSYTEQPAPALTDQPAPPQTAAAQSMSNVQRQAQAPAPQQEKSTPVQKTVEVPDYKPGDISVPSVEIDPVQMAEPPQADTTSDAEIFVNTPEAKKEASCEPFEGPQTNAPTSSASTETDSVLQMLGGIPAADRDPGSEPAEKPKSEAQSSRDEPQEGLTMNERIITNDQIADYAAHLHSEERAPGTIEKYLRDARSFAVWLDGAPVTKENATGWKEQLRAQGYAPATINSMLAALNNLFRFLSWNECHMKFLKIQRRLFRDTARELTRTEYEQLIRTAEAQGKHRLALLMEAICATGIRVSEVRYITVEAAKAGRAVISLKGKIRTILIPNKLCRKLLKYAKQQKTASGEIFLTRNGTPLSRRQIWAEMKGLCKAAGVAASKVFPHNFRHLFATAFYRACKDIAKLADVLGHSSIETTRIYLLTSGAEHQRQLDRLGLVS